MRKVTFHCDGCGATHTEGHHGAGAPGWCGLKGVAMQDNEGKQKAEEPVFCPDCKQTLIAMVETLRDQNGLD